MYGLVERLRQIDVLGSDRIEGSVLALTRHLVQRFREGGLEVHSPSSPAELSGISLLRRPDMTSDALHRAVEAAGITASLRNGAVRVSPHYYNTVEEIDQIIDVKVRASAR